MGKNWIINKKEKLLVMAKAFILSNFVQTFQVPKAHRPFEMFCVQTYLQK